MHTFPDQSRSAVNGSIVIFRGCWNTAPLVHAFEKFGYTVLEDPSEEQLGQLTKGSVVACITNAHIDIKRPLRALAIKKTINRLGAPVIFWDRDGPSHMGDKAWRIWLLKHVRFMDVYATHTLQDAGKFAEEVLYLPNAAWVERYNLGGATLESLRDRSRYDYDVSFFGRIDPKRYPETKFRAEFVERLKPALDALNLRYFFGDQDTPVAAQRELIQKSVINLSFFAGCDVRYQGGYSGQPFSWGLPERCYGIPACGGFLLSDERTHALDDFVDGEEWAWFANLSDCVEKIRFHVANFDRTRQIAEAAHTRVMKQHCYPHRAEKILRFTLYWKNKQGFIGNPSLAALAETPL